MQEPAVYTGQVVCDGEGHLNARSCLLEGPVRSRRCMGAAVRLEIPDSMRCSLFPGQVPHLDSLRRIVLMLFFSNGGGGYCLELYPLRVCMCGLAAGSLNV